MSTATVPVFTQSSLLSRFRQYLWPQQVEDHDAPSLLDEAYAVARIALGSRMYAEGIDDDETGVKIERIDADLAEASVSGGEAQELRARRNLLLIQLADAALEDDAPLPGADAEFERALELQRCLQADPTRA